MTIGADKRITWAGHAGFYEWYDAMIQLNQRDLMQRE